MPVVPEQSALNINQRVDGSVQAFYVSLRRRRGGLGGGLGGWRARLMRQGGSGFSLYCVCKITPPLRPGFISVPSDKDTLAPPSPDFFRLWFSNRIRYCKPPSGVDQPVHSPVAAGGGSGSLVGQGWGVAGKIVERLGTLAC